MLTIPKIFFITLYITCTSQWVSASDKLPGKKASDAPDEYIPPILKKNPRDTITRPAKLELRRTTIDGSTRRRSSSSAEKKASHDAGEGSALKRTQTSSQLRRNTETGKRKPGKKRPTHPLTQASATSARRYRPFWDVNDPPTFHPGVDPILVEEPFYSILVTMERYMADKEYPAFALAVDDPSVVSALSAIKNRTMQLDYANLM